MFFRQIFKGGTEFWQFLLTIILVIGGYILGQLPLTFVLASYASKSDANLMDVVETMNFEVLGIPQNLVFFLMLIMFVVALLGLWVGVVKIHKRPFDSIWTGRRSIDWSRIFFGFWVWLGLAVIFELVAYLIDPGNYIFSFEWSSFLVLVLICVTLLPLQTTFEELFVRGYLMQTVGYIFSPRWVALVLPSIVFGLLHMMNPEVSEFGMGTMMTYYIGIAIFLGVITLLDDGLELAIGVHTATNLYGALFVNFEESAIQTPSLVKLAGVNPEFMTLFAFAGAGVFLLIIWKKYGPFDWNRVISLTRVDFNTDYLKNLHVEKFDFIRSQVPDFELIKPQSLDGLEDGIAFFRKTDRGTLLVTESSAPFKLNGAVQKPFQLGYYELIMAVTDDHLEDDDDRSPEYQTRLGHELRILHAISRESHYRTFMSHKAYKMGLEDGHKIYFIMQPYPSMKTQVIDGWKFGTQLVTEISAKQYELAKTQGGSVLIRELRALPDFPFVKSSEGAL